MKGRFSREDILMEDADILVVHKHAGVAVQSAKFGQIDLEHELLNYLAVSQGQRGRQMPYLAVIHRLDQPVEGILVFGKTPQAARKLNEAMQKDRMEKIYLAVTDGKPERTEGKLVDYLKKDGRTNRSEVATKDTPGAKRAELSYRILETFGGPEEEYSLVQIRLKTGRHHQIRVQMAHAGAPLWGDSKYAPNRRDEKRAEGIGLCAFRLTFAHPRTGKRLEFQVSPEGEVFSGFSAAKSISGR